MSPYLPAAGAALLFGLATAMQHRAARSVPVAGVGAVRLTLRLLRNRLWLAGRVADLSAVLLQAVALHSGALVEVQGIVACGVVAALVASAALDRRMPRGVELLGSLVVVVGAVLVGNVTHANHTSGLPPGARWVAFAAVVVAAAGALVLLGRGRIGRALFHPSAVLGAGAGACFAAGSAFLKITSLGVGDGVVRVGTVVGVAGFVTTAAVGNVLAQRSFHLGELAQGLPALVAAEPVAALVIGTALFHERVARSGRGIAGLAGLAILAFGVWALGRLNTDVARPDRA